MLSLIGLAARAKKITYGADLTIKNVRQNKVKLVLLASDASLNTQKFINDKCFSYNVLVNKDFNSIELSNAVGKNNVKVLGITDQGFSEAFLNRKRK